MVARDRGRKGENHLQKSRRKIGVGVLMKMFYVTILME